MHNNTDNYRHNSIIITISIRIGNAMHNNMHIVIIKKQ